MITHRTNRTPPASGRSPLDRSSTTRPDAYFEITPDAMTYRDVVRFTVGLILILIIGAVVASVTDHKNAPHGDQAVRGTHERERNVTNAE